MHINGVVITNGMEIVGYLDKQLTAIKSQGHTGTGIIIGTKARKMLTDACQKLMGQPRKEEETVNKFRGLLLIEDGVNLERVEIIHAVAPVLPVEGGPFDSFGKGNHLPQLKKA